MSESLRRIQYVTTYYEWIQGLRFVPMGLMAVGLAVWIAVTGAPPRLREYPVAMVLAVGIAAGLYAVLGGYYRRKFGDVRATASTRKRVVWVIGLSMVVGLLVGVVSGLTRQFEGAAQMKPVAGLVLFGLSLVVFWYWTGRVVHHYLGMAAVVVALGVLDALGLSPVCALLPATSAQRCTVVTLFGTVGMTITVMGVMDHLMLVRLLGAPPESESESEEAPQ